MRTEFSVGYGTLAERDQSSSGAGGGSSPETIRAKTQPRLINHAEDGHSSCFTRFTTAEDGDTGPQQLHSSSSGGSIRFSRI